MLKQLRGGGALAGGWAQTQEDGAPGEVLRMEVSAQGVVGPVEGP